MYPQCSNQKGQYLIKCFRSMTMGPGLFEPLLLHQIYKLLLAMSLFLKVVGSCSDPGIFLGGLQARRLENSLDVFFVVLNLQRASIGFITEKTILSMDPGGGGSTFSRGATFSTGVQIPIYIETHLTWDFTGVRNPYPPSGSANIFLISFWNPSRTNPKTKILWLAMMTPYDLGMS